MTRLILASRSAQRRAILTRLGVPFQVRPADVQEILGDPSTPPREVALRNALLKAQAVARAGELVLGVDTVVELEGQIYGKPAGEQEARSTLSALSARTHSVHSGVALLPADGVPLTGVASTAVTFRELSAEHLERYLATGEWHGRAGGYAIQGLGATLVRRIDGEYENVVGLPVATLLDLWPALLGG